MKDSGPANSGKPEDDPTRRTIEREHLVAKLRSQGIRDRRVWDAIGTVPRELFVEETDRECAYQDRALPIGSGQTISQPFVVALMAEALRLTPDARVLEVGTGSGYAAAVLAYLAAEVYTIERFPELAEAARIHLREAGFDRVEVRCGDGTEGWPEHAPYDAISVAAGGKSAPAPLLEQLKIGGRLVIPLGRSPASQELVRIERLSDDEYKREDLGAVRFVPLVGRLGWSDG